MHHFSLGQNGSYASLPSREDEKWRAKQDSVRTMSPSRRREWARRRLAIVCASLVILVLWKFSAVSHSSRPESPAYETQSQASAPPESSAFVQTQEIQREEEASGSPEEPDQMDAIAVDEEAATEQFNRKAIEQPVGEKVIPTISTSSLPLSIPSSEVNTPVSKPKHRPTEQQLKEQALLLPEFVYIPFEDAVVEETLEGWEDEWWSNVKYDVEKWGNMHEPKIDFVYLWVNGSDSRFAKSKHKYEMRSPLNDRRGYWIRSHGVNRYRDWDELRYSIRSLERYTGSWRHTIQLLVNSFPHEGRRSPQMPTWLRDDPETVEHVRIVPQEELFDDNKRSCLPTFNSLTIENQIFNVNSSAEHFFALSDDMLLGKQHAASDFYSPLYGPMFSFKPNGYNVQRPPTDLDARRFGEKPYLIFTSWLLNRRFGERKRKGQVHFGHSISRRVMKEAMSSFPRGEVESACQRFRGEGKFQLYSWYVAYHYTVERHREVLLWSYLMKRADPDQNENLSWRERQQILSDLEAGIRHEGKTSYRQRNYYHLAQLLEDVGLESPKVNTDIQWTSLDGPLAIKDIECMEFDVDECLAPGFSSPLSDATTRNPVFSTAAIFDRVTRADPHCGDCLLKLLLNQQRKGFAPLLPHAETQADARTIVLKALRKYQYVVAEPDALFVMVTDAEQVETTLLKRFAQAGREVGQLCLNDDVTTTSDDDLKDLRSIMHQLYEELLPTKGSYER